MEEQLSVRTRRVSPRHWIKKRWYLLALTGIALLSFWLNFYAIGQLGYGNAYYAAAIRSMTQSWHNFFYISFDPAGVVSVDKPPVGLWVQALFVMIFGYHGWAMLLPQALAGAGSSVMMYVLTAKRFGRPAGLISALVFAVTPAVVVASRNNTMDMQLVLVLLVAAWFLFRAIETGKNRWIFLCAVMIGLGFNIKMLQAYMILPAVILVYLLCGKGKLWKRFVSCAVCAAILIGVSLSWTTIVDLTPTSQRPYVGSSTNNTEWQLIFGHNGAERLSGGMGGGMGTKNGNFNGRMRDGTSFSGNQTGGTNNNNMTPPTGNQTGGANNNNMTPPTGNQTGGTNNNNATLPTGNQTGKNGVGGGATGNDIGTAGITRLWQQSMYGQASWLLIPAIFCILACLGKPKKRKLTPKQGAFLFWVVWLVAVAVFFSFASFYHRYYLCMMAPGIAGVVGIGFPEMLREFRERKGWKQWLMPLCTVSGAGFSAWYVWTYYEALRATLFPVIVICGAAALILMAVYLVKPRRVVAFTAAALMGVSLLAGSFYWSLTATLYVCENVTMPYAGPELAENSKTPGMTANQGAFVSNDSSTQKLEDYLVKNYKEGSYLVVGQRANDVAQFIVDTGLPAVSYGGFLGSDNALTLTQFKQLVNEGKITYVLVSSQNSDSVEGSIRDGQNDGQNSSQNDGWTGSRRDGQNSGQNDGDMRGFQGSGSIGGGQNDSSGIISYVESNATKIDTSEYGGKNGEVSAALYCFNSSTSTSSSSSSK